MRANCEWAEWVDRIEDMLDSGDYDWAYDTLEGIQKWVRDNEHITEKQKASVENIEGSLYR